MADTNNTNNVSQEVEDTQIQQTLKPQTRGQINNQVDLQSTSQNNLENKEEGADKNDKKKFDVVDNQVSQEVKKEHENKFIPNEVVVENNGEEKGIVDKVELETPDNKGIVKDVKIQPSDDEKKSEENAEEKKGNEKEQGGHWEEQKGPPFLWGLLLTAAMFAAPLGGPFAFLLVPAQAMGICFLPFWKEGKTKKIWVPDEEKAKDYVLTEQNSDKVLAEKDIDKVLEEMGKFYSPEEFSKKLDEMIPEEKRELFGKDPKTGLYDLKTFQEKSLEETKGLINSIDREKLNDEQKNVLNYLDKIVEAKENMQNKENGEPDLENTNISHDDNKVAKESYNNQKENEKNLTQTKNRGLADINTNANNIRNNHNLTNNPQSRNSNSIYI